MRINAEEIDGIKCIKVDINKISLAAKILAANDQGGNRTIILSSFGLRSPIIREKVREHLPKDLKVLVIPFAGFNSEITAKREIDEGLLPFGFEKSNICVCGVSNIDAYKCMNFDLIYVPGGDQFKLLYECQKNEMLGWIKQRITAGCRYFGVSAGADLATSDLEYLKMVDECNYELENFAGLGLIEEKVICHIDRRDAGTLEAVRNWDGRKTIFLRNDEVYVIE